MFESQKKRKKTSKERLGKSGGELKLSAKGDEDARKYLADMDTPFPERFRYRDSKKEDENNNLERMKTVKSAYTTVKDDFIKVGEFEFPTGWMEVGYDKNTKEIITSFKGGYRRMVDNKVFENRPYFMRINEAKVRSNDKSFEEGVVSLRTSKDRSFYKRVLERWENFSDKKDNNTTYDSVEPFHQTKEQDEKLEQLRDMRRQSNFKDSGLDKAITGVNTYKNKKDNRNVTYKRKFQEVIEDLRTKVRIEAQEDVLLYLLKKKQMEEQQIEKFDETEDNKPNETTDNTLEEVVDEIEKEEINETTNE